MTNTSDDQLIIRGLRVAPVAAPDHEILQGIDLTVGKGEVHAIMGPNGSGKTTLAYALMGHPAYVITGGEVVWKGRDILKLSADKRARLGMFLAFQYPTAIPGLSVASFIRSALNAKLQGIDKNGDVDPTDPMKGGQVTWKGRDILALSPDKRARLGLFLAFQYPTAIPGLSVASFIRSALNARLQGIDKNPDIDPTDSVKGGINMRDFRNKMREKMALLRMDEGFASRYVNEGFSGGEKKRLEMLQMAVLEPEMAILDETDSGLDIDALRIVAEGVNAMLNPSLGVLLITHYQRLLNYITPDQVHVLAEGRIVKSGGKELALQLEEEGYGPILREAGLDFADDEAETPEPAESGTAH